MKDDKEILNFLAITEVELGNLLHHILSQMRSAVAVNDYLSGVHCQSSINIRIDSKGVAITVTSGPKD
jgi:hypothetical protein